AQVVVVDRGGVQGLHRRRPGSALATEAVPVSPPARARFSITTLLPRRVPILSSRTRPKVSAGPPAGNGTTSLMARLGNSWAEDAGGAVRRRARRHARRAGVGTRRPGKRNRAHIVWTPTGRQRGDGLIPPLLSPAGGCSPGVLPDRLSSNGEAISRARPDRSASCCRCCSPDAHSPSSADANTSPRCCGRRSGAPRPPRASARSPKPSLYVFGDRIVATGGPAAFP